MARLNRTGDEHEYLFSAATLPAGQFAGETNRDDGPPNVAAKRTPPLGNTGTQLPWTAALHGGQAARAGPAEAIVIRPKSIATALTNETARSQRV
jgi:hypothetical protein